MSKSKKIAASFLVVSVLGENFPNLLESISKVIADANCCVVECRSTLLGSWLAGHILVSGKWNQIAKAETLLNNFSNGHSSVSVLLRRTEIERPDQKALPYTIYAIAIDEPGITHKLIEFFSEQGIVISELNTHTYKARVTGTGMISFTMQINVPADLHIADLRDAFMVFSDNLNIDAIMEPDKS